LPIPRGVVLIILVWFGSVAPCLFFADIAGSSEAREVHIVDTMQRTGEWILPTRNGLVPSKPPLTHWLALPLALVVGSAKTGMVRLVSLLASVFMLVGVALLTAQMAIAHRVNLTDKQIGTRHIWWSLLITLSSYHFIRLAIDARVDMVFAACITWSLYGGLSVINYGALESSPRRKYLHIFFLGAALAILAKGPLGIVLPVILTGLFAASVIGIGATFRVYLRPDWSWLWMILPLSWYLSAAYRGGEVFIQRQLFFENIDRILGAKEINNETWWFYLPSFLHGFFPWSILLLATSISLAVKWYKNRNTYIDFRVQSYYRAGWGLVIAFISGIVIFSVAAGKRHSYLLPLVPLVSVYLALYGPIGLSALAKILNKRLLGRLVSRLLNKIFGAWWVPVVIFLVILEVLKWIDISNYPRLAQYLISYIPIFQIFLVIIASVACWFLWRMSVTLPPQAIMQKKRDFGLVAWSVVFSWTLILITGCKAALKPHRVAAQVINELVPINADLVAVRGRNDEYLDPVLYYLRRVVGLRSLEQALFECSSASSRDKFLILEGALFYSSSFAGIVPLAEIVDEGRVGKKGEVAREKSIVLVSCPKEKK